MKKVILYILSLVACIATLGAFPLEAFAVTRMYISNAAADKTLPSVQGTWTNSTNSLTKLLDVKSGAAATQASPTSSASGDNFMIARWQTLPLSADTSFSTANTIQYVIGAVVSSVTNTTMHFRVHAFVIEPDGSTVRGTLLSNNNGTGTAWTATATGRTDSTIALSNNVSAKAGDRIVVEIGFARSGSSNANRTATFNYGNTGSTDLASASTAVTTNPGWIEFSNTFTTTAGAKPTVTTQSASGVGSNSATFNGTISANGGFLSTVRGFAWGTNSGLNGGDTATTSDTAGQPFDIGAFTDSSETLNCGTTYYYRPYATNSVGTGLGTISSSFTTTACSAPTVTTGIAGNVSPTSATLFGSIVSDGGASITQYGFATSTSVGLTTDVSTTTLGSGSAGEYSGPVLLSSSNTVYYYRAYATNSVSTSFGSIRSFNSGNTTVTRKMRLFQGYRIKIIGNKLILYQQ